MDDANGASIAAWHAFAAWRPRKHATQMSQTARSTDAGQFLQQMPILQAVLLGRLQRLRRVAVLVEVLGEAALAAGEIEESHFLAGLGVLEPVVLDGRVADQR